MIYRDIKQIKQNIKNKVIPNKKEDYFINQMFKQFEIKTFKDNKRGFQI